MANYELLNDRIDDIMIVVTDGAGNKVPAPVGDVFNVASSEVPMTTVNAIIATMPSGPFAGAPSLRINGLKKLSTATISLTVSDADGLQNIVLPVDVVEDVTPKAITLDIVDAVHTSQAVPAA